KAAFGVWPLVFVVMANFSGFTVRIPTIPAWLRWLCDLSFCRWIYQANFFSTF
ncbi:unnamed protein product, partial [Discosporangium mesarthrocarpum]